MSSQAQVANLRNAMVIAIWRETVPFCKNINFGKCMFLQNGSLSPYCNPHRISFFLFLFQTCSRIFERGCVHPLVSNKGVENRISGLNFNKIASGTWKNDAKGTFSLSFFLFNSFSLSYVVLNVIRTLGCFYSVPLRVRRCSRCCLLLLIVIVTFTQVNYLTVI